MTRRVTLYGMRHGWATKALEGGASSEQVAAALGNSPAMVARHYSHLTASNAVLKELMEQVARTG